MLRIEQAGPNDKPALMALYDLQKGRPYCPWTADYPAPENVDDDLAHEDLFVMREDGGRLAAAISIDRDEAVDALACWTPELRPAGEIARLAVRPDCQNRGLARQMVAHVMDVLRARGCRSIRLLVNARNVKAIRSYRVFCFDQVGECDMYGQHFLCLEKAL